MTNESLEEGVAGGERDTLLGELHNELNPLSSGKGFDVLDQQKEEEPNIEDVQAFIGYVSREQIRLINIGTYLNFIKSYGGSVSEEYAEKLLTLAQKGGFLEKYGNNGSYILKTGFSTRPPVGGGSGPRIDNGGSGGNGKPPEEPPLNKDVYDSPENPRILGIIREIGELDESFSVYLNDLYNKNRKTKSYNEGVLLGTFGYILSTLNSTELPTKEEFLSRSFSITSLNVSDFDDIYRQLELYFILNKPIPVPKEQLVDKVVEGGENFLSAESDPRDELNKVFIEIKKIDPGLLNFIVKIELKYSQDIILELATTLLSVLKGEKTGSGIVIRGLDQEDMGDLALLMDTRTVNVPVESEVEEKQEPIRSKITEVYVPPGVGAEKSESKEEKLGPEEFTVRQEVDGTITGVGEFNVGDTVEFPDGFNGQTVSKIKSFKKIIRKIGTKPELVVLIEGVNYYIPLNQIKFPAQAQVDSSTVETQSKAEREPTEEDVAKVIEEINLPYFTFFTPNELKSFFEHNNISVSIYFCKKILDILCDRKILKIVTNNGIIGNNRGVFRGEYIKYDAVVLSNAVNEDQPSAMQEDTPSAMDGVVERDGVIVEVGGFGIGDSVRYTALNGKQYIGKIEKFFRRSSGRMGVNIVGKGPFSDMALFVEDIISKVSEDESEIEDESQKIAEDELEKIRSLNLPPIEEFVRIKKQEDSEEMSYEEIVARNELDLAEKNLVRETIAHKNAIRDKKSQVGKIMYDLKGATGFDKAILEKDKPQSFKDAELAYRDAKKELAQTLLYKNVTTTGKGKKGKLGDVVKLGEGEVTASGEYSEVKYFNVGLLKETEEQHARLEKAIIDGVPAKERSWVKDKLAQWAKIPRWKRVAISSALVGTAVGIAGGVGAAATAGGIALRFGRAYAGATLGQLGGKIAEKEENIRRDFSKKSKEKKVGEEFNLENFEEREADFVEFLKKQSNSKKRDILLKAGINLAAGAGVAYGLGGTAFGQKISNPSGIIEDIRSFGGRPSINRIEVEVEKPAVAGSGTPAANLADQQVQPKTGTVNPTSPVVPEAIKPITVEVQASSLGAIDTISQFKQQLAEQYANANVTTDKIPPEINKILDSSPEKFAIDSGLWKPGQTAESAMLRKGDTLVFENNKIVLKHVSGKTDILFDDKGVRQYGGQMFDSDRPVIKKVNITSSPQRDEFGDMGPVTEVTTPQYDGPVDTGPEVLDDSSTNKDVINLEDGNFVKIIRNPNNLVDSIEYNNESISQKTFYEGKTYIHLGDKFQFGEENVAIKRAYNKIADKERFYGNFESVRTPGYPNDDIDMSFSEDGSNKVTLLFNGKPIGSGYWTNENGVTGLKYNNDISEGGEFKNAFDEVNSLLNKDPIGPWSGLTESSEDTSNVSSIESTEKLIKVDLGPSEEGEIGYVAEKPSYLRFNGKKIAQVVFDGKGNKVLPLNDEYQFGDTFAPERRAYAIMNEKLWSEGVFKNPDYRLKIDHNGGRIDIFRSKEKINIFLNGKEIGSGLVKYKADGNVAGAHIDYNKSLGKAGFLTPKNSWEKTFDWVMKDVKGGKLDKLLKSAKK